MNTHVLFIGQLAGPPPSLAEQLKQVLAERERRCADNSSSAPQSLEEEFSQAVNEANARSKPNHFILQRYSFLFLWAKKVIEIK